MKTPVGRNKNTLDEINRKKNISEFVDKAIENFSNILKEKKNQKNKQSVRELWANFKG